MGGNEEQHRPGKFEVSAMMYTKKKIQMVLFCRSFVEEGHGTNSKVSSRKVGRRFWLQR